MRQLLSDVEDGSLGAVNNTETVGNKCSVRNKCGQLGCEFGAFCLVLGGLARIEADVLQQEYIALGQTICALVRVLTGDITGERDVLLQALR